MACLWTILAGLSFAASKCPEGDVTLACETFIHCSFFTWGNEECWILLSNYGLLVGFNFYFRTTNAYIRMKLSSEVYWNLFRNVFIITKIRDYLRKKGIAHIAWWSLEWFPSFMRSTGLAGDVKVELTDW